jgi:hypothetical protein
VLLGNRAGPRPRPKIMATLEDSQIIVGPPGSGKSIRLKETFNFFFPGPVVATSTKLDIIQHTANRRKRDRGPGVYCSIPNVSVAERRVCVGTR